MNNSKKDTIVRLVSFIVEPLKVLLFTIFISFFGFNYTGKEDTPIYLIVMMASFAISLLFYVLMPAPKKLRRENLLYCFFVFIFIILGFILLLIEYSFDYSYAKYFFFFIVFSLPSLLWGLRFGNDYDKNISFLKKWIEPFSYILSLYCVLFVLIPILTGKTNIRSDAYQSNVLLCLFIILCLW